jgi:predicted metalloenzyme YecM
LIKNNKKDNDFSITKRRLPAFHQINDAYIYRLNHRNLQFFISFLSSLPSEQNELQKILINAIRRFGKALSNYNLNQRIVEIFTIMESLVVPNAQANILESLTRYCSKFNS